MRSLVFSLFLYKKFSVLLTIVMNIRRTSSIYNQLNFQNVENVYEKKTLLEKKNKKLTF